jgi:transcriptional regulator GlxA family with amidase domain
MTKTIAILAASGFQLLDVCGPLDVFSEANAQSGTNAYRIVIVSKEPGPIASSSGARLVPDYAIAEGGKLKIDTLLVAGCPRSNPLEPDTEIVDWIRSRARGAKRFGSICGGAFLLANTGLLAGRRVTTHWAAADALAKIFPDIEVDEDAIFVRDGPVRTAAGVTAGLDLALALVEEDLGREVALNTAAQLVTFFRRPGGQMQFSRREAAAPAGHAALQDLQRWIAANPAEPHTVASLARRMNLSARHFARLFRTEVGATPASWVEASRVVAARRLFESGDQSPRQVAAACGFTGVNVFRRAFARHVGVTPAEYRKRFAKAASH